jgi:hypothetical protein
MFKNKKYLVIALIICAILVTTSCAPGNYRWNQTISPGHKANFWAGLWHGIIIIITFIVSLFNKQVGIYEVNNYGWPYNLGFVLGLMMSIGGGFRFTKKRKR